MMKVFNLAMGATAFVLAILSFVGLYEVNNITVGLILLVVSSSCFRDASRNGGTT